LLDPRKQRSLRSVEALTAVLERAISSPDTHLKYPALKPAIESQSGIAELSIPDLGIRPMSLNTLKRTADAAAVGGFLALDNLRKRCAVESRLSVHEETEKVATKRVLLRDIKDLKDANSRLKDDVMFITDALRTVMAQSRVYATAADSHTQARCRKEQREILTLLGLRPTAGGPVNVAKLSDK
jgi:hypothetical protein